MSIKGSDKNILCVSDSELNSCETTQLLVQSSIFSDWIFQLFLFSLHSDEWQCTMCTNADDMVLAEIEKKDLTMGPGKRKAPSGLTEKELKVWGTFLAIYWLCWSSIGGNLRTILSNDDNEFWIFIGAITVWMNTGLRILIERKKLDLINIGHMSSLSYPSFSNQFCLCNVREVPQKISL